MLNKTYSQWKLTKEGEDSYKLSQEQGAALEINSLLFLDLKTHYPHSATWKIERVSQEGDDAYMYVKSSSVHCYCPAVYLSEGRY